MLSDESTFDRDVRDIQMKSILDNGMMQPTENM